MKVETSVQPDENAWKTHVFDPIAEDDSANSEIQKALSSRGTKQCVLVYPATWRAYYSYIHVTQVLSKPLRYNS